MTGVHAFRWVEWRAAGLIEGSKRLEEVEVDAEGVAAARSKKQLAFLVPLESKRRTCALRKVKIPSLLTRDCRPLQSRPKALRNRTPLVVVSSTSHELRQLLVVLLRPDLRISSKNQREISSQVEENALHAALRSFHQRVSQLRAGLPSSAATTPQGTVSARSQSTSS